MEEAVAKVLKLDELAEVVQNCVVLPHLQFMEEIKRGYDNFVQRVINEADFAVAPISTFKKPTAPAPKAAKKLDVSKSRRTRQASKKFASAERADTSVQKQTMLASKKPRLSPIQSPGEDQIVERKRRKKRDSNSSTATATKVDDGGEKVSESPLTTKNKMLEHPQENPAGASCTFTVAGKLTKTPARPIQQAEVIGTRSRTTKIKQEQRAPELEAMPPHSAKYIKPNSPPTGSAETTVDFDVNEINVVTSTPTSEKNAEIELKGKNDGQNEVKGNLASAMDSPFEAKIPLCASTPFTPPPSKKARRRDSAGETNSVKKKVEAFEKRCRVAPLNEVKSSIPIRQPVPLDKNLAEKVQLFEGGKTAKIVNHKVSAKEHIGTSIENIPITRLQSKTFADKDQLKLTEEKENEALKKKEDLMRATAEDVKRKREAKGRKVAAAREAQEKEKMEQLQNAEKEKEERLLQVQKAKEERQKQLQIRRAETAARKAAEAEERRKLDEAARLARLKEIEEENNRIIAAKAQELEKQKLKKQEEAKNDEEKGKKKNYKAKKIAEKNPFQDLHTDDSTDDECKTKRKIPAWAVGVKNMDECTITVCACGVLTRTIFFSHNDMAYTESFPSDCFPRMPNRPRTSSAIWNTIIQFGDSTINSTIQ